MGLTSGENSVISKFDGESAEWLKLQKTFFFYLIGGQSKVVKKCSKISLLSKLGGKVWEVFLILTLKKDRSFPFRHLIDLENWNLVRWRGLNDRCTFRTSRLFSLIEPPHSFKNTGVFWFLFIFWDCSSHNSAPNCDRKVKFGRLWMERSDFSASLRPLTAPKMYFFDRFSLLFEIIHRRTPFQLHPEGLKFGILI